MVISDLNLLCVEQQNKSVLNFPDANITVCNRNTYKECIYNDKYIPVQEIDGFWYQIEPKSRLNYDYKNEYFDLLSGDRVLFLKEEYKQYLKILIKHLLDQSPVETVYLIINLQGREKGSKDFTLSEFIEIIDNNYLLFNVAYKLTKK